MSYAEQISARSGITRCPGCPRTNPVIPPDGPPNSPYLFIGEAPGKEENSRGRPFIGNTGREFNNHYLPLAGLGRDDIRITNCVKCFTTESSDGGKFQEMKRLCTEYHLRREIQEQNPSLIVPMGAVACSLIPDELNLDIHHGVLHKGVTWWNRKIDTYPMWHPAAGLHKTETMIPLRVDFIHLGKLLRGEAEEAVDEHPEPVYEDLGNKNEVQAILDGYDVHSRCYMDTETEPGDRFWCLTFTLEPGMGFMIRKDNRAAISTFTDWIYSSGTRQHVFHNGMYDLPVLEGAGIKIPWRQFDDTMVRSYHLQYLPQGLKALAFRLCGMYMEEFEDIVLPYSVEVMMDYIIRLASEDWPKPEPQNILDKDGNPKVYKPQGLNTKLKRMITDYGKNPSHKVFKRWEEWGDEEKLPALTKFGDLPKPSIIYVPLAKAVWYACRDADATCRVYHRLEQLKRGLRKERII